MLSYLEFHAIFVLPALLFMIWLSSHAYRHRPRTTLFGITLMMLLALVYTTPWDNHLIALGAWGYDPEAVTMRIWNAPIGEYAFFILQSVLAGSWASYIFKQKQVDAFHINLRDAVIGGAAGATVGVVGLILVFVMGGTMLYLGSILAWAGPVFALQWAFGWRHLLRHWKTLGLAIIVPTLYLVLIDRLAIGVGLWYMGDATTTGALIPLLGLPVEEALFFLVTNLFIAQGLFLLYWVSDQTDYFDDYQAE